MSKRMLRPAREQEDAPDVQAKLSPAVRRLIDSVRKPFASYLAKFRLVEETRSEFAPIFMKAYHAWAAETGIDSFVAFVREVDPRLPIGREDYKGHSIYQAALYLQRLSAAKGGSRRVGASAAPARSKLSDMARMIAAFLPLVSNPDEVWEGLAREFALTTRQVGNLRTLVARVEPIAKIKIARPQPVQVIHMEAPAIDKAA